MEPKLLKKPPKHKHPPTGPAQTSELLQTVEMGQHAWWPSWPLVFLKCLLVETEREPGGGGGGEEAGLPYHCVAEQRGLWHRQNRCRRCFCRCCCQTMRNRGNHGRVELRRTTLLTVKTNRNMPLKWSSAQILSVLKRTLIRAPSVNLLLHQYASKHNIFLIKSKCCSCISSFINAFLCTTRYFLIFRNMLYIFPLLQQQEKKRGNSLWTDH